jgi:predicted nucleic acid-binding protein
MILVDTCIWIDHLRDPDSTLIGLLDGFRALAHPFAVGELALGSLRRPEVILTMVASLPQAVVATDDEVLDLIRTATLSGQGIGYVDAHLIAATRLTVGAMLWTRDRRLRVVAERLSISAFPVH